MIHVIYTIIILALVLYILNTDLQSRKKEMIVTIATLKTLSKSDEATIEAIKQVFKPSKKKLEEFDKQLDTILEEMLLKQREELGLDNNATKE